MNGAIIVQARMSSERMPGKVLSTIQGKLLLQHLLESIESDPALPKIIVATSSASTDDAILSFCEKRGTKTYRGKLFDVASRFYSIIEDESLDYFIRICADSPLIHPEVIRTALDCFLNSNYDIVTNTLNRSFPKGQSVEIVRASFYKDFFGKGWNDDDHEHVTSFFYKEPTKYKIHNFFNNDNYSSVSLTVDHPEDYERMTQLFRNLELPPWNYPINEFFGRIKG